MDLNLSNIKFKTPYREILFVIIMFIVFLVSVFKSNANANKIKPIYSCNQLNIEIKNIKIKRGYPIINDSISIAGNVKVIRTSKEGLKQRLILNKDQSEFYARNLRKGDRILKDTKFEPKDIFRAVRDKDTLWFKINQ